MSVGLQALKDHVKSAKARQAPKGAVFVDITHNLLKQRRFAEIPFDVDNTLQELKARLYAITGSKPKYMELTLNGVKMEEEKGARLRDYSPQQYNVLHVTDTDPNSTLAETCFDDLSKVEKYEITEEDYNKRDDTFRKFVAGNKHIQKVLAEKKDALAKERAERREKVAVVAGETPEQALERIKVGMRCQVQPGDRRGEVKFVGFLVNPKAAPTPQSSEGKESLEEQKQREDEPSKGKLWVGVQFDEPVGKGTGVMYGKRLFTAPNKHASFLDYALVAVGDFPEEDPFDMTSSDEDSELEEL